MDKTDTFLLIYKKGGLKPSVVPSPPQSSNLSLSLSLNVVMSLVNKFLMNFFDL